MTDFRNYYGLDGDDVVDIRKESYITITDTYTKGGTHLQSVAKTQDGRIVWEEGRCPSKDVWFLHNIDWPWEKDADKN